MLKEAALIKDPFEYLKKVSSSHTETDEYYFFGDKTYRMPDVPFGLFEFYDASGTSDAKVIERVGMYPEYYGLRKASDFASPRVKAMSLSYPLSKLNRYLFSMVSRKMNPSNRVRPYAVIEYKNETYLRMYDYVLNKTSGSLFLKQRAFEKAYDTAFDELCSTMLAGHGNLSEMLKITQIFEHIFGENLKITGVISSKTIGEGRCESEVMVLKEKKFDPALRREVDITYRKIMRTSIDKDGTPKAYESFSIQ
jgi:hypothetical protein